MIFRVSQLARARANVLVAQATSRRYASSQVTTSSAAKPSGFTAFAQGWYNLFGSSTARYATFLAVGVILAELVTNSGTDALWEMNNRGRTYQQVDWSKFDPTDDDDEDEEEEDDDDDDDE